LHNLYKVYTLKLLVDLASCSNHDSLAIRALLSVMTDSSHFFKYHAVRYIHASLHRNRDACDRLNGKVLHGKCLRVELSSTSNSQKIPRVKANSTCKNPSPPPRRRDTRQPPNANNSSNTSKRSGSSSGSSSSNKASSVPKQHVPPVSIVVSDSGPRVYNGKLHTLHYQLECDCCCIDWLDKINHFDAIVWCCNVCTLGEWGARITGMARDTTWQEVKNMLLRYGDIQHNTLATTITLLYLHARHK
jgi:hypothetical protein